MSYPPPTTPPPPLSEEDSKRAPLKDEKQSSKGSEGDSDSNSSHSSNNRQPDALPAYTEEDAERLFPVPAVPSIDLKDVQPLRLPVAVPQVRANWDASFVRAWSSELEKSGIQCDEWLKFVDGLNVAMAASPPLRVVDLAGMVIGFVPFHWAIWAGAAMQITAQTAAYVLSKTLTDRYLRRANTTYFEPRGLKVRLMKTAAVQAFVSGEEMEGGKAKAKEGESGWKKAGKTAGSVAQGIGMHLPIAGPIIKRFTKPPQGAVPGMDIQAYRMSQFATTTLPLSTSNLPPPYVPDNLYEKTNALGVKLERARAARKDGKRDRQRQLLALANGELTIEDMGGLSRKESKQLRRHDRRMRRSGGGRSRGGPITMVLEAMGLERQDAPGPSSRLTRRVDNANRLEMKRTKELVWIVLLNAEDDKRIEGRDKVDTDAPEETVDNAEWDHEIEVENKHDAEELRELEAAANEMEKE